MVLDTVSVQVRISIHALLAESDGLSYPYCTRLCYFYPRSPCGERPPATSMEISAIRISIHALLAESDCTQRKHTGVHRDFYPRSPCGERRVVLGQQMYNADFYPRSPCGERLSSISNSSSGVYISIHALLAESDRATRRSLPRVWHFYPRSPCGERPLSLYITRREVLFLSTLSLRRATGFAHSWLLSS